MVISRGSGWRALLAAVALLAALAPARARAGDFFVGVDEDGVKWGHSQLAPSVMRALGVEAIRITLPWHAGASRLGASDQSVLQRAIFATWGLRVVVSVYGTASETPRTDEARTQYCDYVGDLLTRNPTVSDVVIWNDPNDGAYWQPQYGPDGSSAAPAEYQLLLAACWTRLHELRPTVNVIAPDASTSSVTANAHDVVTWFRKLGTAYRASGRTQPIVDTFAHVPHGASSAERPWARHTKSVLVGEGDYGKLVDTVTVAFGGTAQPVPGPASPTIWYLGQGFQTQPDATKARLYSGKETDGRTVPAWSAAAATDARKGPAPDQATQLADAVRIAYCQSRIGAIFNFHIADEPELTGWQSGVLWTDWTPKPSYSAFRRAVAETRTRTVNCRGFSKAGVPPRPLSIAPAADLRISQLKVSSLSSSAATVTWKTSIPAEASVAYGLPSSGPTVWTDARGATAKLGGLTFATTYRVWLDVTAADGQREHATLDVRTHGAPRTADASIAAGNLLVDGQPFFPFMVWSQCPKDYGAILAVGVNLFAENPCGGLGPQLDSLAGRALSAAVAGKDPGGSGPGLIGYFLPDEPDGLGLTPAMMPPRPQGRAGDVGFLTLTNHFYSGAAPLPWPVDYPGFISKSDLVGFDLYPLQEWCRPERMGDVYASQQELVRLAAPRPTFQWIEVTDWKCPGGATAVTPATIRAESWLAIAGGAEGLGFFPSWWSDEQGRAIADVTRDVAKLGPALLAPTLPTLSSDVNVKTGARAQGGAIYVIAVNSGFAPVTSTLNVAGLGDRVLDVLDERRQIAPHDDVFTDSFGPLEVHVYIAEPVQ